MSRFGEAMKSGVREIRLRGRAVLPGGRETELMAGDFVSARISEGSDSGILPGSVLAGTCSLVLNNSEGQWDYGGEKRGQAEIKGGVFSLEMGVLDGDEWVYEPMGVFVCRDAACDEGAAVITLSLSDRMEDFGEIAFEDALEYPKYLGEVAEHVFAQAGAEFLEDGGSWACVIDKKPAWGDISVRNAMGYLAQAAGCFVRMSRLGEVEMVSVKGAGEIFSIGPEVYMSRKICDGHFGPVGRLSIETVNAEGDEKSGIETIEMGHGSGSGAEMAISGNPLYITGGEGASELAQCTMEALAGLEYTECRFEWRGDPEILPGGIVEMTGVDGKTVRAVLSRQSLEFSGGFFAECVCGVPEVSGDCVKTQVRGGLDADRIIGVIPGRSIAAQSITAEKIAAGAISAEKISAGAVEADKISAGAVTAEKISAGAVEAKLMEAETILAGLLRAGKVTAEMVEAGIITAEKIAAGAVKAVHIGAGEITAEKIAAGSIGADRLKAGLITADSGLIDVGAIQNAQIADGSITSAKIVSLNADVIDAGTLKADRLLISGEGGIIYEINAVSGVLTKLELTNEKYQQYLDGKVIAARSITADQIRAASITGNEIAANAITAGKMDVGDVFASEAVIDAINAMDIRGNGYLKMYVDGVTVGARNLIRMSRDLTFEGYGFTDEAGAHLGAARLGSMRLGG